MSKKKPQAHDLAREEGLQNILTHPLYSSLLSAWHRPVDSKDQSLARDGLAAIDAHGNLHLHPTMRASVQEWEWAIAHVITHLGMEHHKSGHDKTRGKNLVACMEVNKFLEVLKVGKQPDWVDHAPQGTPEMLQRRYDLGGAVPVLGANKSEGDLLPGARNSYGRSVDWEARFAEGLRRSVKAAVAVAGGELSDIRGRTGTKKAWELALSWFVSEYPLLGGVALGLKLVDDPDVCLREHISIAAVSPALGELYVNPKAALSISEWKFVMAHEMLHVGLRHDVRQGGRDHEIFNVACDLVINQWLIDMNVGSVPAGLLYDPSLKGLSAEEVYDKIVVDKRHYQKLMTLRGVGIGDILDRRHRHGENDTVDLDAYYRRALAEGLDVHVRNGRGTLPAGLIEEIRALDAPIIPWDVELSEWFDEHFPILEPVRTYSRPSRRQGSTPDIPRPSRHLPEELTKSRTFAVVLDTSGSMDRALLGKALGTIASYANSRDVQQVRLVFCDAVAYDEGYKSPEDIAQSIKVRGRGGTVLQPGVDLIQDAEDFPPDGPLLIITDGYCERKIEVKRDHAYVIPAGSDLPFTPTGPVFRVS